LIYSELVAILSKETSPKRTRKSKSKASGKTKPTTKPKSKAKPAAKPKAKPAAKPKAKPAAKPKAKPAAKPKKKTKVKAKPKPRKAKRKAPEKPKPPSPPRPKRIPLEQPVSGVLMNLQRGTKQQYPQYGLIRLEGVTSVSQAAQYIGRTAILLFNEDTKITGRVMSVHGKNGVLRVRFRRGLAPIAISKPLKVF
jgi:ribosomal protein L35AE/L33A